MSEQAGRELDALIAEKVMGLTRCDESYDVDGLGRVLRFVWRDASGECVYTGDMFLPPYSNSIEAAWEVVKKITTDFTQPSCTGFGVGFKMEYRTESAGPNYLVTLVETSCAPPFEEMRDICTVVAGTAPLAICLAALKVVGA